jgi:hypothetical protein
MAGVPPQIIKTPMDGSKSSDFDVSMRYLRTPVDVQLNITFGAEDNPVTAALADASDEGANAPSLPTDQLKRLIALEPQMTAWLAASDDNRLSFLNDPVSALQQIDKNLDALFLKQLRRVRRRPPSDYAVDSRIRVSQVIVAVDQKPVANEPLAANPGVNTQKK